ncbi:MULTISPECIES: sugar transferase [unclassified Streptomyces]|uniref:sugar transferase n=1 Tax=unclassified Streptomyces TaxID=2593676 RepID=UPI00099780EE|nr:MULTISPECIES: sugar transferase [unclassified Streptomyces]MYX32717.1 exopolysaccharide biosynthesis polyprenyl glycosylphosphotransferase [Streptomyces sp. SID8377]
MHAEDALRVRLADPDGSHRAAVLAEVQRRAGGQPAPAKATVHVLVGSHGASLLEEDHDEAPAPALKPLPRRQPRPVKPRWYLPAALTTDAVGAALPVGLVLDATLQQHPVLSAAAAATAWLTVRTTRRRYTESALGKTYSAMSVLHDWMALLGVLAIARALLDYAGDPWSALLALTPSLLLTTACHKLTYRHLVGSQREARSVRRVLVVGEPNATDYVVRHLAARTDHDYAVVGTVPVGPGRLECGAPVAARLKAMTPTRPSDDSAAVLTAIGQLDADLVLVIPSPGMAGERLRRLTWTLHDGGTPVAVMPGITEVSTSRVEVASAAGLTLLNIRPPLRRGFQLILKLIVDRVGAALGLLLLAPLFALIAAAIRIEAKGPTFYQQIRHGLDGAPFTMWKFRTMRIDADARKPGLASANENDGLMFKMRRDPRVTRVGRFLRRWSLDELPQLINILRGEMSLVGPRPPLPEEVARYNEVELRRLSVKPGLTGLWQVSGRSDLSWDESIQLDLRYIDNWTLARDINLMARTPRAVVDGRGAY